MGKVHKITQANFDAEVTQSTIPVVLDFYADWCGPCKMLTPIFETLSEKFEGQVKFGKVDVETNQELFSRFKTQGVPTLVFFKDGKKQDVQVGLPPIEMLVEKVRKLTEPLAQS